MAQAELTGILAARVTPFTAAGHVPVIAGAGALTSRETVPLSQHAAEAGASAGMILPRFDDGPTAQQPHRLPRDARKASRRPAVHDRAPSASGLSVTPPRIAGLAQVEGVRRLKDTSGDAVALTALPQAHGDRTTTFDGWGTSTFDGIAAGAKGAGWGPTNLILERPAGRGTWSRLTCGQRPPTHRPQHGRRTSWPTS
jgi:dihydrodipicolinate synthase/N-acetylneuraminate lyase